MLSHTIDWFTWFVHGLKWSLKLDEAELSSENTASSVQQSACNTSTAPLLRLLGWSSYLLQLVDFNYLEYTYPK